MGKHDKIIEFIEDLIMKNAGEAMDAMETAEMITALAKLIKASSKENENDLAKETVDKVMRLAETGI